MSLNIGKRTEKLAKTAKILINIYAFINIFMQS